MQPYQLRKDATNSESEQALNFRASIEMLYNSDIPVRLQPIFSAQKMLTDSKIKLTEESFKHQVISKLFAGDEDMNKIKKTWTELGRSRKNNFAINNKVNNKGNAKLLT